jgi:hypothetical protein
MPTPILYHGFWVYGYHHVRTCYKAGALYFHPGSCSGILKHIEGILNYFHYAISTVKVEGIKQ